jgi:hypothetical protein
VDGIPVVVAAQFPLSFVASVRMVEILYERLLWGEDPRLAISDLRRSLHAELGASHDWAGITAYAELESEFETYLPYQRLHKISTIIAMATNVGYWGDDYLSSNGQRGKIINQVTRRLDIATNRLQELLDSHFAKPPPYYDRTAPYWYQQGATLNEWLAVAQMTRARFFELDGDLERLRTSVISAQAKLWESIVMNRQEPLRAIRYLWLEAVLNGDRAKSLAEQADGARERNPAEIWATAHALAIERLHHSAFDLDRYNALADLLMLYLVSLAFPGLRQWCAGADACTDALECGTELAREAGTDNPVTAEVWQALSRYLRWYRKLQGVEHDELTDATETVLGVLAEQLSESGKTAGPVIKRKAILGEPPEAAAE